jgi:2-oxoglutarate decarboxylase
VPPADGGLNEGLLEDFYERYRENPASMPEGWRRYFESAATPTATPTPPTPPPAAPPERAAPSVPAAPPPAPPLPAPTPSATPPTTAAGEPLRGAAARTVANMEASLRVPTATSVRAVPAKLLEVNRQILNNQLGRVGQDKVSFTHLIAFAVVQALADFPGLRCTYEARDGQPTIVRHEHMNLGLAVDVTRADGTRTLLVPVIRQADELDFAGFWAAYEALIRKVRANQLSPDDLAGATGTITNPGMIGTVHSVPRLLPGQAFIVGVGSIGFPAEFAGADPHTIAELGVSPITTLTNTYDHRIIGGADSGEFLRRIHGLLLGDDGFYDQVFRSTEVPYEPARWLVDQNPLTDGSVNDKVVHVHALINMYRVRGHLIANLDPLGRREPHTHPELDIAHYGLSIWDLDREFPIGSLGDGMLPDARMPLRDILGVLRDAYARTIGVEYMHIQEPAQKEWIQQRVETPTEGFDATVKRRILGLLNAAEAFERFLGTKYLGQKRFSLEGAETLIPMLDAVCSAAADTGITEVVMGMAHRGRLNVLANVLGKSYAQIFREFEGELDPSSTHGSGDVKYHLGQHATHHSPAGHDVTLRLAANPSHLEAVDPVVEGMARAVADRVGDPVDAALPLLVHGDAAFAGQGVVAETLNLSEVEGYDVGGTIHLVVNNQLGFTTSPESGRSGVYATDVAKMVQAPIFHVNGDDPEACVRVMDLAFAFRETFHKDVVVDLVCYRRYGHNEADEPAFTQPRMYALIDAHPSVRERYTEQLVQRGDLTAAECDAAVADFRGRLDRAFEETHEPHEEQPEPGGPTVDLADAEPVATAVDRSVLERVVTALTTWPDTFHVNPKLARLLMAHRRAFDDGTIDWSLGEAAAFG